MSSNEDAKKRPLPEPREVRSSHTLKTPEGDLPYTAVASTLHLGAPRGGEDPRASIFSVSYLLDGDHDPATRPVTFAFNGGPGSSSVWLHLGALGPMRVDCPDADWPGGPPYPLVDNPEGLLAQSDLVFVDPVGTGFSEAIGEATDADFYSLEADAEIMAAFVDRWLITHNRWASPRYMAGESYGTTRAAAVLALLAEQGVMFNGLLCFSVAFDFRTFISLGALDLPLILTLPGLAATGVYHGRVKLEDDLMAHLERARAFARGPYASALFQGSAISADELTEVSRGLEALTGVPATRWQKARLRLTSEAFRTLLLADEGRTVGRLDSRFTGREDDPMAVRSNRDPAYFGPLAAFTGAVNELIRHRLGFDHPERYVVFSMEANEAWSIKRKFWEGMVDVTDHLRAAMLANPRMGLFVASGLYDLATPFFATEYSLNHLGDEPEIQAAIRQYTYPSGHMMYLHAGSRAHMKADMAGFYEEMG